MSAILCPVSLQTIFRDGRPIVGAKVLIYDAGTTTPKTVFKDSAMKAAHPRPILTDGQGMIPPIYVGKGDYKIRILTSGNIIISEVDGLTGFFDGSETGDTGQTYPLSDPYSVFTTGDILAAFRTGSKAGFARCNGNTIGNSYSAASEIPLGEPSDKNQPIGSTYKLFIHLWELQEVGCKLPVYANGVEVPRGSTAISDWDNNRQIGLPDFRGRVPAGLDGMGGPVSNRLQVVAELTTTSGSTEAFIPVGTSIIAGMTVSGTGVRDGTVVTLVDGLTVTLSLPAKATTSASSKFSLFVDPNVLGAVGGNQAFKLLPGQLPAHKHDAATVIAQNGMHQHDGSTSTGGQHQHSVSYISFTGGPPGMQGGTHAGELVRTAMTSVDGAHAHTILTNPSGQHAHTATTTIENFGKDQPYGVIQPSIGITWYIKL